jgi:hypothetical protein
VIGTLRTSHRARVRAGWAAALGGAAVVVAALIVLLPNTGHKTLVPIDYNREAKVVRTPPTVSLQPADRAAVLTALDRFLRSAVLRQHPGAAWALTTAYMRRTTSRHDWLVGDLPVAPYPVRAFASVQYTLRYSWPKVVGYDMTVMPKRSSGLTSVNYRCELHHVNGRWLVQYCYADSTPHRDGFANLNNARP